MAIEIGASSPINATTLDGNSSAFFAAQTEVDLNTSKDTNVAHLLVESAVPVGAIFTDTVYDDSLVQTAIDTNRKLALAGL